jgi:hypothetical protein
MRIKSIGSNKTELHLKDLTLLISYETPVCLIRYGVTNRRDNPYSAVKTDKFWSVTTSKHINQWLSDNGLDPKLVPTVDQQFLDQYLDDNE